MRRKRVGQSLVEMALLLPFMLFLLFAIIDLGWYIYGYATIYNAARRGSEEASQIPPYETSLDDESDPCTFAIAKAVRDASQPFFKISVGDANNGLTISYPTSEPRKLGAPIEVAVVGTMQPLTPLMSLGRTFGLGSVGPDGTSVIKIRSVSRRTVESLGFKLSSANGSPCQP